MLSGPPSVMMRRQSFGGVILDVDGDGGTYLSAGGYYLSAGSLLASLPQEIRVEDRSDGNGAVALFEGKSKNLITEHSEDLTGWAAAGSPTVTANAETAPDGTNSASNIDFDANDSTRIVAPLENTVDGITATTSVWAKCASGTENFRLVIRERSGTRRVSSDFTVTTDWQRFDHTHSLGSGITTPQMEIQNGSDGSARTVSFWGAQLEQSPFPTSYIHTQNLLTQSENFAHSDWVKANNATVTANSDVAPDGSQTADTLTDSTTDLAEIRQTQNSATVSGKQYTISFYLKKDNDETRYPSLRVFDGSVSEVHLNTKTGNTTFRSSTHVTASSQAVEAVPGWWRWELVYQADGTNSEVSIGPARTTTPGSLAGGATGSIVLWGAQLVEGSSTKPYTKTQDTLQAERHADTRTFAAVDVPTRVFSGAFKGAFYPYFSDTDLEDLKEYWILSVNGNQDGLRVRKVAGNVGVEYVRGGFVVTGIQITFSRHQKISFTLDHGAGSLTVSGATTGNGTATGTSGSWTAGPVRIAGIYGTIELLGFETGGTFTRNYEGYYLDVDTLKVAAIDVRRFEDRDDGHGPVFLAEGSSTNLLTRSEEFDHADWFDAGDGVGGGQAAVTANSDVAPDGNTTADTIEDDNASGFELLKQVATVSENTDYTWSNYVKKDSDETRFPEFVLATGASARSVQLNTATGATTFRNTTLAGSVEVLDIGDYWYLALTVTTNAGATALNCRIYPAITDTFGGTNTAATGSIVVWGAQLEESEFPTSYIKTVSASATRAAESLTFSAAEVPEQIENGVWAIDVYPYWSSGKQPNPLNSGVLWYFQSDTGKDLRCLMNSGKVVVREQGDDFTVFMDHSCTWSRHQKLTLTFDFVNETVKLEGFTTGNGTDSMSGVNWGTLSSMAFGNITAGGQPYYGRISNIRDPDNGEAFMRIEDLKNA